MARSLWKTIGLRSRRLRNILAIKITVCRTVTLKERVPKMANGVDALHNVYVSVFTLSIGRDVWITQYQTINCFSLVDWCGEPPEVQGAVVTTTGHKAGSIAAYSCHRGFVAVGGQQVSSIKIYFVIFVATFAFNQFIQLI